MVSKTTRAYISMYFEIHRHPVDMLSMSDVLAMSYLYEQWPARGITGTLQTIPPKKFQEGVLESEFASMELKDLARRWIKSGALEVSPFDTNFDNSAWDISLAGKIGYPKPAEFTNRKDGNVVNLEAVRAAVKINVVGSLIIFLTDLLPLQCGCSAIRDLYLFLKDPRADEGEASFHPNGCTDAFQNTY